MYSITTTRAHTIAHKYYFWTGVQLNSRLTQVGFRTAADPMMEYASLKLTSAALLLLLTLVCSYMPWAIQARFKKSKIIMSYLNCLAGGVVLGALLMHMIPELSHSHLHSHAHAHAHGESDSTYHLSALARGHSGSPLNSTPTILPLDSIDIPQNDNSDTAELIDTMESSQYHDTSSSVHEASKARKIHSHKHSKKSSEHKDCHHHKFNLGHFFAGVSFLVLLAVDRLFLHSHSHSHDHGHESGLEKHNNEKQMMHEVVSPATHCRDLECAGIIHSMGPEDEDCASCHSEDLVGGCHLDGLDTHSSRSQALIFVIALSLHSFLEGLGAAAQNSEPNHLFIYLISLFGHKWLEAFALGVNVLNAKFSLSFGFFLIALYSALTPLGILLGMLFQKVVVNAEHVESFLNGCAVGSFIFVSCIEMIPPEFHKKTFHTVWKFAVLCVGFLIMSAVSLLHS